jgi:AcrR family transcriptional regulator
MINEKPTSLERLMAAAAVELRKGDGDFEMSAVARTAGVSVGLAYHYFGSKAGLIAAVVEQFYEELDQEVMMAKFGLRDWREREKLRVERNVAFHYRHPLAPVVLRRLRREPSVIEIERERVARQVEEGTRNIISAQKQGTVVKNIDPAAATAFTLAGIRALISQALEHPPEQRPSEQELANTIWRLVRRAIGSDSMWDQQRTADTPADGTPGSTTSGEI